MPDEKDKIAGMKTIDYSEDLNNFFEGFLKSGVVIKEKEVVPGLTVKLKVLNTSELLSAESILLAGNPNIPSDIIQKIRAASILSQAILIINGVEVEKENMIGMQIVERRQTLYSNIIKMPAYVIQKIYELYIEAVREQNDIYSSEEKVRDKVENF